MILEYPKRNLNLQNNDIFFSDESLFSVNDYDLELWYKNERDRISY